MSARIFPPGTILQRLYIKKRLQQLSFNQKTFLEFGGGDGSLSNLLLNKGLSGMCFDLNNDSCLINESYNSLFITQNKFSVLNENLLEYDFGKRKFDVIISSMVIEHLDENSVNRYYEKCKSILKSNGVIITLVPANMDYWGIEDEIAGHFKRYCFDDFKIISKNHSLKIKKIAGLTYPLSNFLFPLSNYFVKKQETAKLSMTKEQQTLLSGNRNVRMKTHFPKLAILFLNEITLFPFYLMQILFKSSNKAMVIYCELTN